VNGERILVTGASGFLGSTVASALSSAEYKVRQMWRRPAGSVRGEIAVVPDLLDRQALRAALKGVDGVVHLAAHVHDMAPTPETAKEFRRTNVDGTRTLLEEASAAGARKFILFSSVKAVGEANSFAWTEETPPHPVDAYGASKLEAESLVLTMGQRNNLDATVLRLPLAYGPGMKGNMLRLFDAVRRGIPLPFRNVENKRSMVYSENVAEAVRCCLRATAARDEVFFVSDAFDLSTPELVTEIALALGKRPTMFAVPGSVLGVVGQIGDRLSRPGRPFPINSEMLQRLLGSLTVDPSKLKRLTGYTPAFSPREGIRRTASWYVSRDNTRGRERDRN
jgi:nucleoside-diphosphate-sugar epimerase